ncbi:MAG: GNAT family N-acetyltransferase [Gammaproteobacteria bacterium]
MIKVREQHSDADIPGIEAVSKLAFPDTDSSAGFRKIRQRDFDKLSLVAIDEKELVGHILFLPAVIEHNNATVNGMGLVELAVTPGRQRQGIGGQLIEGGLRRLSEVDCPFVLVVGHAGYYPKFGFRPGREHNLKCQWDGVSEESFMVRILDETQMSGVAGIAAYTDKF